MQKESCGEKDLVNVCARFKDRDLCERERECVCERERERGESDANWRLKC